MKLNSLTSSLRHDELKLGLSLALFSSFLFSLKPILIKQAYELGANSESVMLIRMWMALPFYLLLLTLDRQSLIVHKRLIPIVLLVGFLGYFVSSYLDLLALEHISAQTERIILYAYPSIVVLLKCLYAKAWPSRRMLIAMIAVYIGILLFLPGELSVSGSPTGIILMLVCAFTFALYVLVSKPMIERMGTRLFTSAAMLAACAFTQLHLFHTDTSVLLNFDHQVYIYVFLLAFFGTVIPSYTMSAAIKYIGSEKAAITGTTGPVFTTILAVVWLGETFSVLNGFGLILVVGGVWLLGRR